MTIRHGSRQTNNLLYNTILHVDVRKEGLIIIHNLYPFDKETIILEQETNWKGHDETFETFQKWPFVITYSCKKITLKNILLHWWLHESASANVIMEKQKTFAFEELKRPSPNILVLSWLILNRNSILPFPVFNSTLILMFLNWLEQKNIPEPVNNVPWLYRDSP